MNHRIRFLCHAESLARRKPIFPSIKLNVSFAFTETPSSQRLHGERSLSQRRTLAESMANARQLVESKGAVQSILTCDAENPQNHSFKPSVFLRIIIFFMKVGMMNDFYVLCMVLLVRGENFC